MGTGNKENQGVLIEKVQIGGRKQRVQSELKKAATDNVTGEEPKMPP